jgi:hypothetical protein
LLEKIASRRSGRELAVNKRVGKGLTIGNRQRFKGVEALFFARIERIIEEW